MAETIRCLTVCGPVSVQAEIIGPLAVHPAMENKRRYVITHLASGARIPALFESETSALSAASEIVRTKNFWDSTDPEDFKHPAFRSAAMEIVKRYGGTLSVGPRWNGENLP